LLAELCAAPPVLRRSSTVTVLRPSGAAPLVRRYADGPRGRTVSTDECDGCPQGTRVADGATDCDLDPAGGPPCVRDLMTRTVRATAPDVPLVELVGLLEEASVTGAPVLDERGHIVGVVSQSDVVRTLAERGSLAGLRVVDVMMHAPFCVEESASVDAAAALLAYEGIHRLPVVNAKHEVVGIVSALDLVRWSAARGGRRAEHVA
jgi:CBS domain-containing protein